MLDSLFRKNGLSFRTAFIFERGIGELGITGAGAAIANAVYNACGTRVRALPITLDKLMA